MHWGSGIFGFSSGPTFALGQHFPKTGKKNENVIFGINVSRRLRKVIICHVFGGILTIFNAQKMFSAPLVPKFIITD